MASQDHDAAMAAADKEMEERANRAKQLLSQRYRGLRNDQVRNTQDKQRTRERERERERNERAQYDPGTYSKRERERRALFVRLHTQSVTRRKRHHGGDLHPRTTEETTKGLPLSIDNAKTVLLGVVWKCQKDVALFGGAPNSTINGVALIVLSLILNVYMTLHHTLLHRFSLRHRKQSMPAKCNWSVG